MRILLQRVRAGSVAVGGEKVAEIGQGFVILVGVGHGDSEKEANWLARKCAGLRLFEDQAGKINLSLQEVEGEALVVSQFTLYANTRKGRRPSFIEAAPPDVAEPLVEYFAGRLKAHGIPTKMGIFGEEMLVKIENDGPVTIWIERNPTRH
jgi:D-tyrosyl-tRNA(Tyr) deacylase